MVRRVAGHHGRVLGQQADHQLHTACGADAARGAGLRGGWHHEGAIGLVPTAGHAQGHREHAVEDLVEHQVVLGLRGAAHQAQRVAGVHRVGVLGAQQRAGGALDGLHLAGREPVAAGEQPAVEQAAQAGVEEFARGGSQHQLVDEVAVAARGQRRLRGGVAVLGGGWRRGEALRQVLHQPVQRGGVVALGLGQQARVQHQVALEHRGSQRRRGVQGQALEDQQHVRVGIPRRVQSAAQCRSRVRLPSATAAATRWPGRCLRLQRAVATCRTSLMASVPPNSGQACAVAEPLASTLPVPAGNCRDLARVT